MFVKAGPYVAGALALLGLVVRLTGISEYWLNTDEGIYYSTLTHGTWEAFWTEVAIHAHPPGYYLLLRALGALTWDFVLLRVPSAVFGAGAIWAMWLVGRELGGRGRAGIVAGWVTAALMTFSGPAIVLSQVLRPYALLVLLVALSLFNLLRYRREPTPGRLWAYAGLCSAAMLTHFSGMLSWLVLIGLVGWDRVSGRSHGADFRRLVTASLIPAIVFVALLAHHVWRTVRINYMSPVLGEGGWLEDQVIHSPSDVWRIFVEYQIFAVPAGLVGRAALLFAVALALSAFLARRRALPVLVVGALGGSVLASALGLYPLGQTRHSMWLVPFTLPLFGWLASLLFRLDVRRQVVGVAASVLAVALLSPLERVMHDFPNNRWYNNNPAYTEEQFLRPADIARLFTGLLDPAGAPPTILMTQQPYYVLMPLFADLRDGMRRAAGAEVFSFPYGSRNIVVIDYWD